MASNIPDVTEHATPDLQHTKKSQERTHPGCPTNIRSATATFSWNFTPEQVEVIETDHPRFEERDRLEYSHRRPIR